MIRSLGFYIIGFFLGGLGVVASDAHAQTTACSLDISDAVAQLFGMPSAEVLGQAFGLGLVPPLTGYLVAYCVGLLVSQFNDERG